MDIDRHISIHIGFSSTKDMQTQSPPLCLAAISMLEMAKSENQFSDFYLLSYSRFCSQFSSVFTVTTIKFFANKNL